MAKKQSRKRTVVGSPLTLELLFELGALRKFPPPSEDFDPTADWVNTYRIWTCHGYRESGNQDVGLLRIRRTTDTEKSFTLRVRRQVVQVDGLVNIIEAAIKCRNDQLACPMRWEVSSRFLGPDSKSLAELEHKETGLATKAVDKSTADWCLFEAVQRLAFDEQTALSFDLLEGLSLRKADQHLSYRGAHQLKIDGKHVLMHCFQQLGHGILPYEYWLSESHRLLAATSLHKAYILDKQAEEIIRQRADQLRQSYQRTKSRKGKS